MNNSLAPLFSSIDVKSLHLRNRFAMAPMTREMSPGGIPTAENVNHYRKRVEGGAALIITEGAYIGGEAASGPRTSVPRLVDEAVEGWREVVSAVHGAGGNIIPQLWHVGALRGLSPSRVDAPALTPSGLDLDARPLGEPMTTREIDEVVRQFASAAALAQRIGFDGVELHGAHGYLLDEFLWSRTNRRGDGYGNRVQMPREVIQAVRSAVGEDFAIVFRFSQWKASRYAEQIAQTPTELEQIIGPLSEAGVDVFHPSTRRHWLPEFPEDNATLSLAGWTKRITGKPVIAVGSVGVETEFRGAGPAAPKVPLAIRESVDERLDYLVDQFQDGQFDVIALGRALIADPDWVAKARDGQLNRAIQFDRSKQSLSGA